MYFVALLINLDISDPQVHLTAKDGIYAFAAITNVISTIDAEAGHTLHELKRNKHMTLAVLHEKDQKPAVRLTFFTQRGLLDANKLINALSQQPILKLGNLTCTVCGIDLSLPDWAGIRTWSDFMTEKLSTRLGFRFITPLAFTKQNKSGERFMSVLPDPKDVFMGLNRRWKALAGPPLAEGLAEFIESGGVVIASHWLRTLEFDDGTRVQIGCVGQVVYECHTSDQAMLQTINSLARMAPFVGLGYQTGRGMGAVQVKALD